MMEVSVIIVNYNVRAFLESALHSAQKALQGLNGEIIVVDNASQDYSAEMVRERFPDVRLIASTVNLGFGKANNKAMQLSEGRYLLILNPDTIIQEETLRTMIAFMDDHPDAGMAGCKVLNADGSFQLSCRRGFPTPWASFCKAFGLSTIFPKVRVFAGYNLTYLDENGTYIIDALAGSFMMVRREVFTQTGGFDEDYFMYGEDLDWCYRTQKAGWNIWYTPVTQIIHYKGESTKRSDINENRIFYDAMRIFVKKNLAVPNLFILFLRVGIATKSFLTLVLKRWKIFALVFIDSLVIIASLLVATKLRFGSFFGFPEYAYPTALIVPLFVTIGFMLTLGVYGKQWRSFPKTILAIILGFLVISTLPFFFKNFAFSRQIVLEMTTVNLVVLGSVRIALNILSSAKRFGESMRKAVIIGMPQQSLLALRKLRGADNYSFEIMGFVSPTMENVGENYEGMQVIGATLMITKIIQELHITDVIFVAEAIPYSEMVAVMNRTARNAVAFRLIPGMAENVIAKSGIVQLDDLPIVALELNIQRLSNKFIKRAFDMTLSGSLLPIFAIMSIFSQRYRCIFRQVSRVFIGTMSFVGPEEYNAAGEGSVFGKAGMVSVKEMFTQPNLSHNSGEKGTDVNFDQYYARNQSFYFDMQILWNAWKNHLTRNNA